VLKYFKMLRVFLVLTLLSAGIPFEDATAQPQENMSVGLPEFAPYFVKKPLSGLFINLINEIFSNAKLPAPKYKFYPFLRVPDQFEKGSVQAAANIFRINERSKGYISDKVFYYRDCFFSLAKRNIKIDKFADLKPYTVGSYSGAKVFHGGEYAKSMSTMKNYKEVPNADIIAVLVGFKRVDVGMGDLFIFYKKAKAEVCKEECDGVYNSACILPWQASRMIFKNKSHRDLFNIELRKFKKTTRYIDIYRSQFKGIIPEQPLEAALSELKAHIKSNK
jgi:polar amino acid transport system substrate-binding protein